MMPLIVVTTDIHGQFSFSTYFKNLDGVALDLFGPKMVFFGPEVDLFRLFVSDFKK